MSTRLQGFPLFRPSTSATVPASSATVGVQMAEVMRPSVSSLRLRQEMRWEYRFLFCFAFVWFLVVAVVTRLLPRAWRPHLPGAEPHRSIFGEAWAVAGTLVPFAFMR